MGFTMVFYSCAEFKCISNPELHREREFEESRGVLLRIHESEGFCIAVFAWGAVSLPKEMAERLRELIGKRVSILRLEGYHVRDLSEA